MKKGSITSINWGALALRGLVVNLFSVCFMVYPFININVRILIFAIFALLFGIFSLDAIFGFKLTAISLIELLQGVISIGAGVIALSMPIYEMSKLIMLISFWAISIGVLKYILYYAWKKDIPHPWLPKSSGIMAVLLGVFLLVYMRTEKSLMAIAVYLGAYTFVYGLLLLAFAMDLRALKRQADGKL